MTEYEYGIDFRDHDRRDFYPHRVGMSYRQALDFLYPEEEEELEWDKVFTIIRRPRVKWEDCE